MAPPKRRFDINALEPELFKLDPVGLKESAMMVRELMKERGLTTFTAYDSVTVVAS